MPQRPAQVTRCGRANILAVPVLQGSVMSRVVKRAGLLEVRKRRDEFPFREVRRAHDAMRNTERSGVIVTLGLGKEFGGSAGLLSDLAPDIVARPYSVEDGQLLCGIG